MSIRRGDVFGERALIDDTPRVASVRAKSAVDVLMSSREDFDDLVRQFPVLDDYFEKLMRERYPEATHSVSSSPASSK